MKLIVTARGPQLAAEVDPRFGRARWFVLFDTDDGASRALDNGAQAEAPQGAGVQAAQLVAGSGARCLLTGRCGPKAFATLSAAGIDVYSGACGTVAEAIAAWQDGALARLDAPDGAPRH